MAIIEIDLSIAGNYAPFDGHGNSRVAPQQHHKTRYEQTLPATMTRAEARKYIEKFNEDGELKLDRFGTALWVLETWAYYWDLDVKVVKHPYGVWWIKQLEVADPVPPEIDEEYGDGLYAAGAWQHSYMGY